MKPAFSITLATESRPTDQDLEALLKEVYVSGGYTDALVGDVVFRAANVKARGEVLVAQDSVGTLMGTVTVVFPGSPACRFATAHEAELHLLAVNASHRRRGVGHALVDAVITAARKAGARRLILWTQPSRRAAHGLYTKQGFERVPRLDFWRGGRSFRVYARQI